MNRTAPQRETGNRKPGTPKGVILILVLWIFAGLSLFMYAFLANARVDHQVSLGTADRFRAQAIANSAVEYTIAALLEDTTAADGPWDIWYDNPGRFQDVVVENPNGDKTPYGYFTVFSRNQRDDGSTLQFGPEDEAGKINLNTATRDMLLRLTPRMTDEIVDAILDWRDSDEVPGSAGAESNYYMALPRPYRCKNGPFESVEELLYVRGINAMVMYGEDWNRNGLLDAGENDGEETPPSDNADGKLELGLWHLCTVHSYDLNTTADGQTRVNINTASLPELQSMLGEKVNEQQIRSIVIGRMNGPYPSIAGLLFLPAWDSASFQAVADLVTLVDEAQIPGLVNVNTASRQVLQALPGMTEDLADAVLAYRNQTSEPLENVGWLLNVMDRNVFAQLANVITVKANQFSVQAVGWIPNNRGLPPVYSRIWAVIDMAGGTPQVKALKDLTRLGFPYPLTSLEE
jgi:DNA uptake protein ComE-like DNA-binding protein